MKFVRLKSAFVCTIFTTAVLFAEEPPIVSQASPPQQTAEETKAPSPSMQAIDSIPTVPTKKDVDKATDVFLRGGFCVITALLFLAGFLVVKTNSGQKTYASA
ncbi:MAG: hypothetical protein FJZ59_03765 [Chlamydiae bacterium]|nr:hypothetical protein [Chlamydiota bacterium]